MSFDPSRRGMGVRAQARAERIAAKAAQRQMIEEARREGQAQPRSVLGRVLDRLLRRDPGR
jgi:hypothetical protein